jgi:hypothetical protein
MNNNFFNMNFGFDQKLYTLDHPNIDYSYQPSAYTNNVIHQDAKISSNWNYRRYIQQNAKQIMKHNSVDYITESGNNPYILINNEPSQNVPFLYTNTFDNRQPSISYKNTDLKQDYRTKEMINARMISPIISTNKF